MNPFFSSSFRVLLVLAFEPLSASGCAEMIRNRSRKHERMKARKKAGGEPRRYPARTCVALLYSPNAPNLDVWGRAGMPFAVFY